MPDFFLTDDGYVISCYFSSNTGDGLYLGHTDNVPVIYDGTNWRMG